VDTTASSKAVAGFSAINSISKLLQTSD